jgi:formylglycine-generating enzyme required for sulfatase activity
MVAERGADGRYEVWCADGESFSRTFADGDVALGQLVLVEPPRGSQARRAHPFGDRPLDAESVRACKQAYLERCRIIRNSLGMELARIPAGEFLMGSAEGDQSAYDSEKPQHRVRITKPFYLGVTPVTQEQYEGVMGQNPSQFKGEPQRPVERVSWEDAVEFCHRLSEREGQTYRLPTEAEWEYACRAGSQTKWCFGDDESKLTEYAWYRANDGGTTHPVKQKRPNAWGLYDMHGNVWEWCHDWYGTYTGDAATDPQGLARGLHRVVRGGSWDGDASYCPAACRSRDGPSHRSRNLGFRLARQFPAPSR